VSALDRVMLPVLRLSSVNKRMVSFYSFLQENNKSNNSRSTFKYQFDSQLVSKQRLDIRGSC